MTQIDPKYVEAYNDYIERFRTFEFIDSAIITHFGTIYDYVDNEVDLYTNSPHQPFSTDLLYMAKDKRAIILIEETKDPSDKKEQLIKYSKLSAESAKLITRTDLIPAIDVLLVIPEDKRALALSVYDEVVKEIGNFGKGRGISIWYYDKKVKTIKLCGGILSSAFPKNISTLTAKRIGTFKILKTADPISLFLFIVMKALEAEYGKSQEAIEITREKLSTWLSPYGIIKEERWAVALKIGQELGYISNFSLQQLTGTLNYSKAHPSSISKLRAMLADPFNIKEEEDNTGQRSIFEFDTTPDDTS